MAIFVHTLIVAGTTDDGDVEHFGCNISFYDLPQLSVSLPTTDPGKHVNVVDRCFNDDLSAVILKP